MFPLFDSIKFYLLFMLVIIISKPEFMYDAKQKKYRKFGIKKNNTLFTFRVVSVLVAVTTYIFVSLISCQMFYKRPELSLMAP